MASDQATSPMDSSYLRKRLLTRFYRALDYLSIYAFIVIVYGAAVGADYLLFLWLWALLGPDVRQYPVVATALDYARTILAVLFIATALIHGIISTISQVKLDLALSKEGETQR